MLYPERNVEPVIVSVLTQRRFHAEIAEVERQRRLARAPHVHVALTTALGAHTTDERVLVDLIVPRQRAVRCGQLSEGDSPGWRWLLRMRVEPRVTWVWPAQIVSAPSESWEVYFFH